MNDPEAMPTGGLNLTHSETANPSPGTENILAGEIQQPAAMKAPEAISLAAGLPTATDTSSNQTSFDDRLTQIEERLSKLEEVSAQHISWWGILRERFLSNL